MFSIIFGIHIFLVNAGWQLVKRAPVLGEMGGITAERVLSGAETSARQFSGPQRPGLLNL